jgi:hypothetical protein
VRENFLNQGYLSALDFFCIIIWKSNRAKSKIAKKLLAQKQGEENLDEVVRDLTAGLAHQTNPKEKMRYLLEDWKFRLPMASAILSTLYPEDFTIYDVRVCGILGNFNNLGNCIDFDKLWCGYLKFKTAIVEATPDELNLRDKDRYLWGKSFYEQLKKDIENEFINHEPDLE